VVDLVQELQQLGAEIDVPDALDVAATVRRRLAEPAPARRALNGRRTLSAAAAALVVGMAAAFVLSPQVRATAADLFRFAGVEVQWGESTAPATPIVPLPSQSETDGVARAQRQVAFPIGVPDALGAPEQVLVADGGRVVSLIWSSDGIRLDEFDGTLDPVFAKVVSVEATPVDVAGADGLWFGEPHSVTYVGPDGKAIEESARLSAATLIWQAGDVTYRLEGDLDRAEAADIAESVR
jgi:hypothetical protein